MLGAMVNLAPMFLGTFPIFLPAVSEEFHWGRAVMPQAMLVPTLISVLVFPLAGRIFDRWSARTVATLGTALYALAFAALSLNNGDIFRLYLLYGAVGLCGCFSGLAAYPKLIAGWFPRRMGLMLGLVLGASASLSTAITVPLTQLALSAYGWRDAYIGLGCIIFLVGVPSAWMLLPPPRLPQPGVAAKATQGLSAAEAVRTSPFWLTVAALALSAFAIGGFKAHAVLLLGDRGVPAVTAALLLSTIAAATTIGQIGAGVLLDRIPSPKVGLLFFAAPILGFVLLVYCGNGWMVLETGAVLLGFGTSAEASIAPYYSARYFGTRALSEIQAYKTVTYGLGLASGPVVIGRWFEASGSYRFPLLLCQAALGLGFLLIAKLPAYSLGRGDGGRIPSDGRLSSAMSD